MSWLFPKAQAISQNVLLEVSRGSTRAKMEMGSIASTDLETLLRMLDRTVEHLGNG